MILIDSYDDPTASYRVVADPVGRLEVRSDFLDLPERWTVLWGADDYQTCRDHLTAIASNMSIDGRMDAYPRKGAL